MLSDKHGEAQMHSVGDYQLEFEHRGSWKARRFHRGTLIDSIPVAWTKNWYQGPDRTPMLHVGYQNLIEMKAIAASREPFVIALAKAKDDTVESPAFDEFRGVFEVVATGVEPSADSIEVRVIKRLKGD
jgi:hypothetical protein